MIETPCQLVKELTKLFPQFAEEWDGGESFGYDGVNFSYHSVLMELAPNCATYLSEATLDQRKGFCDLLNLMIEVGGNQENAVSTCLLEHASQIGIRNIINSYLSQKALQELR